jgi:hypothetical protein
MRVEHEKINVVILLAARLADVFTMLADEEFVQLEVFADDGFADGTHDGKSFKHQHPSFRETPTLKLQSPANSACVASCSLVLGVSLKLEV